MEKSVAMIWESKNSAMGISRGVFWINTFFSTIILHIQAAAMIITYPKVSHILLNSKSSDVVLVKASGTVRKRA